MAKTTYCGSGPCASTGLTSCSSGEVQDSCQPDPSQAGTDDTCDGVDDDCDGVTDQGLRAWAEQVPAGPQKELGGHVAIGADGVRHLSLYNDQSDDLVYATNDTGTWVAETVASNDDTGKANAIVVDAAGTVTMVYRYNKGAETRQLKYSRGTSGSWETDVIETGLNANVDRVSAAVSATGVVHVAYRIGGSVNDLRHAWYDGNWHTEAIATTGDVGSHVTIALLSTGAPLVVYRDNSQNALMYAVREASQWFADVVVQGTSDLEVGKSCAVAVDRNDLVHVSYFQTDETNHALRVLNSDDVDNPVTVSTAEVGGKGSSLAVDAGGVLHLVYDGGADNDLRYSTNAGGAWSSPIGISSAGWGAAPHVAVGPQGEIVAASQQGNNPLHLSILACPPGDG